MIDVEAADVVLVGLALTAVLADDDARHRLVDLARAKDRPLLDLLGGHYASRTGLGQAEQPLTGSSNP